MYCKPHEWNFAYHLDDQLMCTASLRRIADVFHCEEYTKAQFKVWYLACLPDDNVIHTLCGGKANTLREGEEQVCAYLDATRKNAEERFYNGGTDVSYSPDLAVLHLTSKLL